MSEELIKRFRFQLGNKRYQELEETWLELLECEPPLTELLNLADLTIRWAPKELAVTLLWVLDTSLADKKHYAGELVVLRRLMELTPGDEKLTRAITNCLRNIYSNEPLLEKLLQKSGLGYGEPLSEAFKRFELYSRLVPNRLIYDQEHGLGRIKTLDLLFDRVEVVFNAGARLTIDVQTANNRFRFPAQDGFFYLQAEQPEKLSQLVACDPAQVVALFLQDIGRPATLSEIEQALAPLVGREKWPVFWERARKGLGANPHIIIKTRPARSYCWLDQLEAKLRAKAVPSAPSQAVKAKTEIKNSTSASYDPFQLPVQEPAEIIRTFEQIPTASERKKFLSDLAQARSEDWDSLYLKLFSLTTDTRTRNLIADRLQKEKPARWQELIYSVLTGYRANPDAFLFLAEKTAVLTARQTLSRLLDIIEMDSNPSHRQRAKKIILAENYQLIANALKQMNEDEARQVLQRIRGNRGFEPFQQGEIITLITNHFTRLAQDYPGKRPQSTVVYSSAAGIEKAKQELAVLTQQELPKSAEEIGRARAFGDLSENYEYKAAKERQARLMARINQLQRELKDAQPLNPEQIDTTEVNIGCRVQLCDQSGSIMEFSILGPWDADPDQGIISYQSPLAQQLLGKRPGENIQMAEKILTVVKIDRALPLADERT
jgi:transcription elongation factor GreA